MLTRKSFVILIVMFAVLTIISFTHNSVDAQRLDGSTKYIGSSSDPILLVKNTDGSSGGSNAISAENASMNTWRPAILGKNTGASAGIFGSSDQWHAVVGYKGGVGDTNRSHAGVWGHNSGVGIGVYGDSDYGTGVKGVAKNPNTSMDCRQGPHENYAIGVYGEAPIGSCSYAGYFVGEVKITDGLTVNNLNGKNMLLSFELTDEYSWYQGQSPVRMIASREGFCFLTSVSGEFAGGGEVVKVYTDGGYWYLGGQSQKEGVNAKARCID